MSKKLKELRQCQHDLKQEATALLDKADAEERDLTAEEEARYSEIEAELKSVKADISAEEKKAERRREMEITRTLSAGESVSDEPDPARTNGFRNLAEFALAVRDAHRPGAGIIDPRLTPRAAPSNYHEGGGTAGEGFMLPAQFRDEIWEMVFDEDDLIGRVDLEQTSARQVDWIADETTPWGSTGIQANWRAESSQMSATKLATEGRTLTLHELYAFVIATEELLADAPRLNDRVTRKAGQALRWKINDSIVYGNGAGQPLGWFNSDALVTVAKEGGQSADTIVAANVLKMYSRLLVAPGDQPFWMANRDIVPQLAVMTIGDQPVWSPPNGLVDAPGGFLLGYPVRWSEHARTLGDKGDIQLVSPRGYYAARRTQGPDFASSMHLYFDYNMQAFRWTFRFAGQPYLSAPVSPANGSNTKSHFVVLAERAA